MQIKLSPYLLDRAGSLGMLNDGVPSLAEQEDAVLTGCSREVDI